LYAGSTLTRGAILLLTLSFILRHQLSGLAMLDLIDLLNAVVPGCLPKTKYYINKMLNMSHQIVCHIYCQVCLGYIGAYAPGGIETLCGGCSAIVCYDCNLSKGNFFIMLPLESQLQELLERSDIQKDLFSNRNSPNESSVKDIVDGLLYRGHPELNSFSNNLSTV